MTRNTLIMAALIILVIMGMVYAIPACVEWVIKWVRGEQ